MDSKTEVQKYSKKEAIIAVCIIIIVTFLIALRPLQPLLEALPIDFGTWSWTIQVVVMVMIPTIILLLLTKQGFALIGIHRNNLWSAVRLGLLFSLIPILGGLLPRILYGGEFVGFGLLAVLLIQVLIRAAAEDMLVVGYMQTRLYSLFKSDAMAIIVGAALFSFSHVPGWLVSGQFSFDNVAHMVVMIVIWFVMHIVFVTVFRRYSSLIPVIMMHTTINFMNHQHDIWTFAENYHDSASSIASLFTLIIPVAVGIWAFVRYRKAKKAKISTI